MKTGNKKKGSINKKYSIQTMSGAIVEALLDLGDNFAVFDSPYKRAQKGWRKVKGAPEFGFWQYNRTVKKLEKSHKIKRVEKNDKVFLKLTQAGKLHALALRLSREIDIHTQWDGKWRVMIWDIPEESRLERNKLRRLVKSLGFYQLQQSVFIIPYPLPKTAIDFLTESGLRDYIRILQIEKMDDDTDLRKHFGL